jgi:hypothetical protein
MTSQEKSNGTLSEDSQRMLDSLRKAARNALERKRKLGQYAVVWENGKPLLIGADAPQPIDQMKES